MPRPVRRPFSLCSGELRRQVGFVQDQPPESFVYETRCSITDTGKAQIRVTLNVGHWYDGEERLARVHKILARGLARGVLRMASEERVAKADLSIEGI